MIGPTGPLDGFLDFVGSHGPIILLTLLLLVYYVAEWLTKDFCKLCRKERRMRHLRHVVWTGLVCKPSCLIKFPARCKDCGVVTKPGVGQSRCPSCWDDKCGTGGI